MNTFLNVVQAYQNMYDFSKPLGVLTRANLVMQFGKYFKDPALKTSLKDCRTLNHMVLIISQQTDELPKERTAQQIEDFETQIMRIVSFAKLDKR